MSRPLRLEYPGSLWHITARGNERRNIFADDADRRTFLTRLGRCVRRFRWILSAYVLMPNHYHLVVQLTETTLSRGMRWLNAAYAQAFNRRHRRVGHLVQGRFKGLLIDKETYHLEVLRYVVLNPVRAGMVARPEDYRWSSHRAVLGLASAQDWLACDDALVQFGPTRHIARANYRCFVDDGMKRKRSPWDDLVGQIYLGGEEWMERVRGQVALEPRSDDHPIAQRVIGTVSMADVVSAVAEVWNTQEDRIRHDRGGVPRMVAAWIASQEMLLTNREIAAGLRIRSQSHASRLVRRCERALEAGSDLRTCVDRTLSTLSGKKDRGQL